MLFRKPKPVLVIKAQGVVDKDGSAALASAFAGHPVNADYHVLVLPFGLSAEIYAVGTEVQKRETR